MPNTQKTEILNLPLLRAEDESSTTFQEWSRQINLYNDGTLDQSAFEILDEFAGEMYQNDGTSISASIVDGTKLVLKLLNKSGNVLSTQEVSIQTPITVDSSLSTTSTNPVQNKVITAKVNEIISDVDDVKGTLNTVQSDVSTIKQKIPSEATSQNKLADKNFVNSSISTNTATFRGNFNVVSDLSLSRTATNTQIASALSNKISTVTNNDYSFVSIPHDDSEPLVIEAYKRFKYSSATSSWSYEYTLNNSSFTASQWASINSGVTSGLIDDINSHLIDKENPHEVTKEQIGLGNVNNTSDLDKPISTAVQEALDNVSGEISTHISNKENPHEVTKEQIGLGNVDNTSDANKPISIATQEVLDTIVDNVSLVSEGLSSHIENKGNPHEVTKQQVGLGNVDNTSDINKPISTATQSALDTLSDSIADVNIDLVAHTSDKENPHEVTKEQIGLGNVDNTSDLDKPISTATQEVLNTITDDISSIEESVSAHVENKENPHEVTKAQIGLENVDNTSDADKPISNATQEALNAITEDLSEHIANESNPHNVTKEQVGLGNVDNTSDIDKPISTAVQGKLDEITNEIGEITSDLSSHINDKSNPHEVTKEQIGLENVDNTSDINKPVSTATQTELDKKIDSPEITVSDAGKVLKVNETGTGFILGSGGIAEIPQATENILGGIKASEKTELETQEVKIDSETGKLFVKNIDVDSELDSESTNPVQNKVITSELNTKVTSEEVQSAIKSSIKDDVVSTDTDKSLSAHMGKVLQDQIDALASQGKYLSDWDCTTGLPKTNPEVVPYTYKSGDHYIVYNIGETNYKPSGTVYDGTASTVVETEEVRVNDYYRFDGAQWIHQTGGLTQVAFSQIVGNATDNESLTEELNKKQDRLTAGENITIDENNVISSTGGQIEVDKELNPVSENAVANSAVTDAIGFKADYEYVNYKFDNIKIPVDTEFDTLSDNPLPNRMVTNAVAYKADFSYVNNRLREKLDIPALPSVDGDYVLKVTLVNGVPTFSWIEDTFVRGE